MIKSNFRRILLSVALLFMGCASSRVPVPPGVVPDARDVSAEEEQYGQEVLGGLMDQFELDRDDNNINKVRDIVDRLTIVPHGADKPWHVYVLKDDAFKNAAATRGNYIFVWTGMIKAVHSDDELAVILAHEIGHILAGHPEPDPQEMVNEIISGVAGAITEGVMAHQGAIGDVASMAGEVVSSLVNAAIVNPAQQQLELEADQIGLFILARSGIDPNVAIGFWDRVQNDPDFGDEALSFLSTHPSSKERVEKLRVYLPDAEAQYRNARRPASREPRPTNPARPADSTRTWRIESDDTTLVNAPDESGLVLRTLHFGDTITVEAVEGKWLKVSSPVSGFVRGRNAVPIP